jgi:predicted glycoside hydrolase/deacetylase ChbG (UPF0249 family)
MSSATTPIVVCADDYGLESGVDAAIVELASKGRLSATGCLVTAPGFVQSASALKALPIDVGLHLNFTENLGPPGSYRSLGALIAAAYTGRLSAQAVRAQIDQQLDLFHAHVNRAPDFVDGHLHVHQLPVIREQLVEALRARYPGRLPWLRDTRPTHLSSSLPWMQRIKARVIGALGARAFSSLAQYIGAEQNNGFAGAYDFSRPHPDYAWMLDQWLHHASAWTVLMTHPAKSASSALAFGRDRQREFQVLDSDDFPALLARYNLRVTRLSTRAAQS